LLTDEKMYIEQAKKMSREDLITNFDRLNRNEDCLSEQVRKLERKVDSLIIENTKLKLIKLKDVKEVYKLLKKYFDNLS